MTLWHMAMVFLLSWLLASIIAGLLIGPFLRTGGR